ncbi:MAG: exonuclease domain-containing protein [Parcubacteria group bacterium]
MRELIFLDTETTGNEVDKDRLSQVSYKTSQGLKTAYFKPPLPMSVKAMSVTHITNKMLEDKETFEGSETKSELEELLKEGVLVAHNARFDVAMLLAEGLEVPRRICTLRLARYLDKENKIPEYNLQYLRYYLDLEVVGKAHDAEGDVLVLETLFQRLFSKMKESESDEEKVLEEMMEISSRPSLFAYFNFGKHKDKLVADVAKTDRAYLEWLLAQKTLNNEDDEDWIYTLRHYLEN